MIRWISLRGVSLSLRRLYVIRRRLIVHNTVYHRVNWESCWYFYTKYLPFVQVSSISWTDSRVPTTLGLDPELESKRLRFRLSVGVIRSDRDSQRTVFAHFTSRLLINMQTTGLRVRNLRTTTVSDPGTGVHCINWRIGVQGNRYRLHW